MTEDDIEKINKALNAYRLTPFPYALGGETPHGGNILMVDDEGEEIAQMPSLVITAIRAQRDGITDPDHIAYLMAARAFNIAYQLGNARGERFGRWVAQDEMRKALGLGEVLKPIEERLEKLEDAN